VAYIFVGVGATRFFNFLASIASGRRHFNSLLTASDSNEKGGENKDGGDGSGGSTSSRSGSIDSRSKSRSNNSGAGSSAVAVVFPRSIEVAVTGAVVATAGVQVARGWSANDNRHNFAFADYGGFAD
jgi:hypothetical protein